MNGGRGGGGGGVRVERKGQGKSFQMTSRNRATRKRESGNFCQRKRTYKPWRYNRLGESFLSEPLWGGSRPPYKGRKEISGPGEKGRGRRERFQLTLRDIKKMTQEGGRGEDKYLS